MPELQTAGIDISFPLPGAGANPLRQETIQDRVLNMIAAILAGLPERLDQA